MPNANRRQIVLVKIEDTHRVDAEPDGTNAVLVRALTPNPAEGATLNERRLIDGSFGRNLHAWGGSLHGIQLEVELKGSGAAGTPPEWAPLLRACGFAEDITVSTSVAYTPASGDSGTPHESVTIYYNQDGVLRRLIGCRGTMTLNAVAREIPVMTFNMIGHQGAADTDTALPTPTLDATVPVPFRAAALSLDSFTPAAGTFTLDLQNEIPQRPDINGADGFADLDILDRNIVGTLNPELRSIASKDWLAKWREGAAMALSIGPVGSVAGNRWALSAGKVQIAGTSFENSDGVIRNPLELAFVKDAGDDDVTLTLT